jgi:hypothetical protein
MFFKTFWNKIYNGIQRFFDSIYNKIGEFFDFIWNVKAKNSDSEVLISNIPVCMSEIKQKQWILHDV